MTGRADQRDPERRASDRVVPSGILVVDDSGAIRRILRRMLEAVGYAVAEAADGRAALERCRSDRPDLVLLDVDMPVMDGHATLRAMRADPGLVDIPVLFLTARTGGSDAATGIELGAQDYLRKPCEPAELVARVAAALQSRANQARLVQMATEAERLSTIDPLTELGNRRRLDQRGTELMAIAGGATRVGVLMIDVDHFKKVNDVEGHPVGDIVLRILARRMGSMVAAPFLLVRWGGEEFVVMAPGVSDDGLAELGEAIRDAVSSSPFAIGDGRVLAIHISVGCACGRLDALDATIEAADEALYQAKQEGRNRVVTHRGIQAPVGRADRGVR